MAKPMPAVFFGHGNPMNAIEVNTYTKGWAAIGRPSSATRSSDRHFGSLVFTGYVGNCNVCSTNNP